MSRDGSGNYNSPEAAFVYDTVISETVMNNIIADMGAEITNSVAVDGQSTMSGNLKMGSNKVTGLAAATANGDAIRYEQALPGIMTTRGDLVRRGASAPERVALGTSGYALTSDGTDAVWAALAYASHLPLPKAYKSGLMLSNNGTDAEHDLDISAGSVRDYGDAVNMILSSALTKQIDAVWAVGTNAGGLDTGSVAADTGYGVYLIRRSDTGVVDALFSTDMSVAGSSVTMPTNYDQKRLIGWVLTDSSANIYAFAHTRQGMQDKFAIMASPPAVVTDSTITSGTFEAATLPVPPLSTVEIVARSYNATAANDVVVTVKPTDSTETYSGTYTWMAISSASSDLNGGNLKGTVLADVSSQISYAANEASGTTTVTLSLLGITLPTE